ncbi:MAG TPA: hypothetical protein VH497_11205 [Vicinamibacterales bacterium]
MNAINGFQLHQDLIADNQVQSVSVDVLSAIPDGNRLLLFERNALLCQLEANGSVISDFDQSRTQLAMNQDAAPYGSVNQSFDVGGKRRWNAQCHRIDSEIELISSGLRVFAA